MPLRFFFDECVDEDVAAALRAHRVDVETTSGLGRKGLSDEEQLAFAAKESRVIYTIDQDFLRLAYCWLEEGKPFPGIVYHRPGQRSKHDIIESLLLMNVVYEPEDMKNHVEFIWGQTAMPIFEYVCKECDHRFEKLVLGATAVECPERRSAKLEKQLSVFAAATKSATHDKIPSGPCGTCGDPRGPGACSIS